MIHLAKAIYRDSFQSITLADIRQLLLSHGSDEEYAHGSAFQGIIKHF
jgi:hypothetical protein